MQLLGKDFAQRSPHQHFAVLAEEFMANPVGIDHHVAAVDPHDRRRHGVEYVLGNLQSLVVHGEIGGSLPHQLFEVFIDGFQLLVGFLQFFKQKRVFALQFVVVEGQADGVLEIVIVPGFGDEAVHLALVDGADNRRGVGKSRKDDSNGVRPLLADFVQKVDPGHAGHPVVGYDHLDIRVLPQGFKSVLTRFGGENVVIFIHEQPLQGF